MTEFEFKSGPDAMTAKLFQAGTWNDVDYAAYISISGTGPRGGFVPGLCISDREAMLKLSAMLDEALGFPHRCTSCGRAEADCSAEPCAAVIADREA